VPVVCAVITAKNFFEVVIVKRMVVLQSLANYSQTSEQNSDSPPYILRMFGLVTKIVVIG